MLHLLRYYSPISTKGQGHSRALQRSVQAASRQPPPVGHAYHGAVPPANKKVPTVSDQSETDCPKYCRHSVLGLPAQTSAAFALGKRRKTLGRWMEGCSQPPTISKSLLTWLHRGQIIQWHYFPYSPFKMALSKATAEESLNNGTAPRSGHIIYECVIVPSLM